MWKGVHCIDYFEHNNVPDAAEYREISKCFPASIQLRIGIAEFLLYMHSIPLIFLYSIEQLNYRGREVLC